MALRPLLNQPPKTQLRHFADRRFCYTSSNCTSLSAASHSSQLQGVNSDVAEKEDTCLNSGHQELAEPIVSHAAQAQLYNCSTGPAVQLLTLRPLWLAATTSRHIQPAAYAHDPWPVTRLAKAREAFWAACSYRRLTQLLAAASVVPALILAAQPLLCGADFSTAAAAVAAQPAPPGLEWQGPLRDMFSFTVLLSVFITCEPGAAAASAVSAAGAGLQLLNGPMPPPVVACCTAAGLAACAALVLLAAASVHCSKTSISGSSSTSSRTQALRHLWQPASVLQGVQKLLGVLGGGLVVQYISTLPSSVGRSAGAPSSTTGPAVWLLPVVLGALCVAFVGRCVAASEDQRLLTLWSDWPAWSATLLLILQPLQQLVESSCQPLQLLPSISASQQSLLVFASGLMVPRALLQRELMWFTGTFSGAALAAGQLAVLAVHGLLGAAAGLGMFEGTAVTAMQDGQVQRWGFLVLVADPFARRAATLTATSAVLLVTWMCLQAGWRRIQAPATAQARKH